MKGVFYMKNIDKIKIWVKDHKKGLMIGASGVIGGSIAYLVFKDHSGSNSLIEVTKLNNCTTYLNKYDSYKLGVGDCHLKDIGVIGQDLIEEYGASPDDEIYMEIIRYR